MKPELEPEPGPLTQDGATVTCNQSNCNVAFHPLCARNAGCHLAVRQSNGRVLYRVYCLNHSESQRRKDLYGAEVWGGFRAPRLMGCDAGRVQGTPRASSARTCAVQRSGCGLRRVQGITSGAGLPVEGGLRLVIWVTNMRSDWMGGGAMDCFAVQNDR